MCHKRRGAPSSNPLMHPRYSIRASVGNPIFAGKRAFRDISPIRMMGFAQGRLFASARILELENKCNEHSTCCM
jgi:hypothetical protein